MITQKDLHVGIYGVITKDDSLLVIRKSRGPYKGLLDLPGGRPLHGELLDQTLKREIQEETGIQVQSFSFFGNFSFLTPYADADGNQRELYHISLIYKVEVANLDHFNPSIIDEDTNGSLWVNRAGTDEKECSPLLKEVLFK